jgi:hypothetical protein
VPGGNSADARDELLNAFRDLDTFLGRSPEQANTVKVPWDTPRLLEFIDLAVGQHMWLLADHLLTHLAARGALSREQARLATRVRNLKATMFVQVPQVPPDSPMAIAIAKYVCEMRPATILDVGAATGLGTTHAFSRAASAAGLDCTIYAMESEPATFELLKRNTATLAHVKPTLSALITDLDCPAWETVHSELQKRSNLLAQFPAEEIQQWYLHGIELLRRLRLENRAPFAALPERIDIAMIDADLFFAREELAVIIDRTEVIMLDDVHAFKNAFNHELLSKSDQWRLLDHQPGDRHGWSAFRRK